MFICTTGYGQTKNRLFLTFQPQDLGVGARYDRLFKEFGVYVSASKGDYWWRDDYIKNNYIKDHYKVAAGVTFAANDPKTSRISIGLSYNTYGERRITTPFNYNVLSPLSIEFGVTGNVRWVSAGFRFDPMKWEGCFDVGFNF